MSKQNHGLGDRLKNVELDDLRPHFGIFKFVFTFFKIVAYIFIGMTMLGALIGLGIGGYEIYTTGEPVKFAGKEPSWTSTWLNLGLMVVQLVVCVLLLTVVRRWIRAKLKTMLEDL